MNNPMNDQNSAPQRVAITDISIPFGSMVVLMVKTAIAAIPALLILLILGAMGSGILISMFRGAH